MMTPKVRKLFNEAKDNEEFQEELKVHEPEEYKPPGLLSNDLDKLLYAILYMGWLIGKGIYNENKYE